MSVELYLELLETINNNIKSIAYFDNMMALTFNKTDTYSKDIYRYVVDNLRLRGFTVVSTNQYLKIEWSSIQVKSDFVRLYNSNVTIEDLDKDFLAYTLYLIQTNGNDLTFTPPNVLEQKITSVVDSSRYHQIDKMIEIADYYGIPKQILENYYYPTRFSLLKKKVYVGFLDNGIMQVFWDITDDVDLDTPPSTPSQILEIIIDGGEF